MEEQITIFEEFEGAELVRRRALLPEWLKIYLWFFMGLGGILILYAIISSAIVPEQAFTDPGMQSRYNIGFFVGKMIPGVALFLMMFLPWIEVRWAIRFNWAIALLWGCLVIFNMIMTGPAALITVAFSIIFFPLWLVLFRVQRVWENEAVKGKQL